MRLRNRLKEAITSASGEGDYEAVLCIELRARALRDPDHTIAGVVRSGQERGEFGPADPDEVAVLLASLLDGLAVRIAPRDMEVRPDRVREPALRLAERELGRELLEGARC